MNEPQQEPEMDWENSPFEEEPMVAEEKTISAVSAASSTFSRLPLLYMPMNR